MGYDNSELTTIETKQSNRIRSNENKYLGGTKVRRVVNCRNTNTEYTVQDTNGREEVVFLGNSLYFPEQNVDFMDVVKVYLDGDDLSQSVKWTT